MNGDFNRGKDKLMLNGHVDLLSKINEKIEAEISPSRCNDVTSTDQDLIPRWVNLS